jgi:hypothetical protein
VRQEFYGETIENIVVIVQDKYCRMEIVGDVFLGETLSLKVVIL